MVNSRPQTKGIILKNDLLKNIKESEHFIKKYQGKSYQSTRGYQNFSNACHFISINQITSQTIANFVNYGAQLLKKGRFGDDAVTFKSIAAKIGQLITNETIKLDTFNSIGIANTFNGLGQCSINLSEYFETKKSKALKDKFIKALVNRIQALLSKFNSIDITNTFNGLGQCGINLSEYFETEQGKKIKDEFIGALVNRIQTLLKEEDPKKQFKPQELANTFNGLGQCSINLGEYLNKPENEEFKNVFIGLLVGRIQGLLSEFNSIDIANTFNGLGQCSINLSKYFETEQGKKIKNAFIGALVNRIQTLLKEEDPKKQFKPQELANTFNGLGQCSINLSEYLNGLSHEDKNDFIGALVNRIQTLLKEEDPKKQFKPQELANTFNGLGQCSINLSEYFETEQGKKIKNAFIGALRGRIQDLLSEFNSIDIANTFNGLGQCGINLSEYFETEQGKALKDKFIKALVNRIQDLLSKFNSIDITNTFNGLGQCGINLSEYFETEQGKKIKNAFIGALRGRIQDLLSEFNSIDIANTFNGLAKCGVNLGEYLNKPKNEALKNAFIGALRGKIQDLLPEFNSIDIANTFNGLGQCSINLGEYFETEQGKKIKNAFIGALRGRIQELLSTSDFNSQELANTFNGLGQCSINLSEYLNGLSHEDKNDFIGALVNRIQTLLKEEDPKKQFKPQALANTFNGLGQCSINLSEYFETEEGKKLKNAFIGALRGKIQDLLPEFNSIGIANTFNGLVKLFLYNKDLYTNNIEQFKDIINNLVQKYFDLSNRDRDNQTDWTVLYNIKYLQVCGFKFNDEILSKIPSLELDAFDDDHTNSTLEKKFETFLSNTLKLENKTARTKNDCYEKELKLTFQVGSHSFQKSIDFCIEFTYNGKTHKAYIELDGPTHFTDTEQTQKTAQTQIRDIITLQKLQEEQDKENGTKILYVTLSAKEFNEKIANFDMSGNLTKSKIANKEQLFKFLIQQNQLQPISERTYDSSKMTGEDKSADSSVKSVASKTTDTDDYTTLTPEQVVSRLAQEAQEEQQKQQLQKTQPIQFNVNAKPFVPRGQHIVKQL